MHRFLRYCAEKQTDRQTEVETVYPPATAWTIMGLSLLTTLVDLVELLFQSVCESICLYVWTVNFKRSHI